MQSKKMLSAIGGVGLIISALPLAAGAPRAGSVARPFVKIGPRAIRAQAVGPKYGLFTCQVVNQSPDVTCYDPYQIRRAYNIGTLINAGFDGSGKTIVIIDAFQSPNIVHQLNVYNAFYDLPRLNGLGNPHNSDLGTFKQIAPDGLTPFDATNADMIGWAEEISLDVLWAHAIAPRANIVLVLAKSDHDPDILSAQKYAVDHHLGDVISQSFGENESCMDPGILMETHEVFENATRKGITLFASSGDFGAAQPTCDGSSLVKAVSIPASDPLVTGVGGTELHAARYCLAALDCDPGAKPAPGTYDGEVVWNEQPQFGASGGGFSVLFSKPPYQQGTIHGDKQRGVPDVAYSAAVTHGGVLTYLDIPGLEPVGFYLFGGTSVGSPQWSAIVAIGDEKAGYNLGFINRTLYHIGQEQKHYSASFHDVTKGNNSFGGVEGFNAEPGWDATTGLGSPKAAQIVERLIQFVSSGDATRALAGSEQHGHGNPTIPGSVKPH